MKREIWKGSEAIAEAAIRAGCRGFFGYPITPQNEIPEYMSLRMPQVGGVFVQAESEVAAINMVYGAAGSGVRAMTSSSSPGVSLKQEGISYAAGAQLPAVIVNVMRGGPGLGSIQPSSSRPRQTISRQPAAAATATIVRRSWLRPTCRKLSTWYRKPSTLLTSTARLSLYWQTASSAR